MDKEGRNTKNIEGLVALYSGVSQNLSMVHDADTAVENKMVGLFAASIVILTILLDRTHTWRILTIIGVVLLSLAILTSLYAIWSKAYGAVVIRVSDYPDYIDKNNRDLVLQLIADAEDSFDESNKILEMKAKLYNWVLVLFTLGLATGLLSFYIKIVGV
jgi:hypothetical protein